MGSAYGRCNCHSRSAFSLFFRARFPIGSDGCLNRCDELEVLPATLAVGSADRFSGRSREHSQTTSGSPARSAFRFRAAKRNCFSRCSHRLVPRSDFSYETPQRDCRFQAVVGFFHPCYFCGAQFGSRNFVSSWQLRVEGPSRGLLSLRELLYPDMFGEGGLSSGLCQRSRFLGALRIISYWVSQLCPGPSFLESRRRTFGAHSYFPD